MDGLSIGTDFGSISPNFYIPFISAYWRFSTSIDAVFRALKRVGIYVSRVFGQYARSRRSPPARSGVDPSSSFRDRAFDRIEIFFRLSSSSSFLLSKRRKKFSIPIYIYRDRSLGIKVLFPPIYFRAYFYARCRRRLFVARFYRRRAFK